MRRTGALFLFAIIFLLGRAVGSSAAQENYPAGSYQQTCSDISVQRGTLYARCQDEKGKAHPAKLSSYEKCGSDITNKNGRLECAASGEANRTSHPSGSYVETCRDIRMNGDTLHAVCKSYDGHEAPATLRNANRCAQGVVNINGILNCQISDVLPPGSYISTCKDVRLQGTTLIASCQNSNGRWTNTELRNAQQCSADIANQNGSLKCTQIKRMEKR